MDEFTDKLEKAQDLYEKKFNDMFPTFPFMGKEPDELLEIINKCIEAGKDAYDMGYVSLDVIY